MPPLHKQLADDVFYPPTFQKFSVHLVNVWNMTFEDAIFPHAFIEKTV